MVVKEPAAGAVVQFKYILLIVYFKLLLVTDQTVLEAVLLPLLPFIVF